MLAAMGLVLAAAVATGAAAAAPTPSFSPPLMVWDGPNLLRVRELIANGTAPPSLRAAMDRER